MAPRMLRKNMSGDEIIQLAVRLGLLAFLVYWSFVLVRPFIPVLVWSMVLTVALYPPYAWLSARLGDQAEAGGHNHHDHQSRDHHRTGYLAWLRPG